MTCVEETTGLLRVEVACMLICTDVRRFEGHISREAMLTPTPTLEQLGFHPTPVLDNREIKDLTMKLRDVTSVITRAAHLTCVTVSRREEFPNLQGYGRGLGTEYTLSTTDIWNV